MSLEKKRLEESIERLRLRIKIDVEKLKGGVEVLRTAELLVTDGSEEYGAEVTGPKDGAGGFFPQSVSGPKLEIGFELEAAVVAVAAMLNPTNELKLLETVGILKFCGSASIF